MKKKSIFKLMFGTILLGMMSLSSCKKCFSCTNGSYTGAVCKDANQNQKSFNAQIKYLRAQGYTCN